jgi:hypothetical protein
MEQGQRANRPMNAGVGNLSDDASWTIRYINSKVLVSTQSDGLPNRDNSVGLIFNRLHITGIQAYDLSQNLAHPLSPRSSVHTT